MPLRIVALLGIAAVLVIGSSVVGQPLAVTPGDARGVATLAPALKAVTPGLVNIAVEGKSRDEDNPLYQDPSFRRFFGAPDRPPERQFHSTGSGVIVDAQRGHSLTNNHVIRRADRIIIGLQDGRRLPAKIMLRVGQKVDLVVLRDDAARDLAATVGPRQK